MCGRTTCSRLEIPAAGHRRTDHSFSGRSFWPRWNPGNFHPQKSNSRLESSWYLEILFLFQHLRTIKLKHFTIIYYTFLIVCASSMNYIIRAGFINWWLERGLERGDCSVDRALYIIICPGALVTVVPNGECKSREAPLLGVEQEPREGNGQSRPRSQLNPSLLHPWRGMVRG